MQVYIFGNGCFFQVFAHHPRKTAHAVTAISFFSVKQPNVRIFGFQVFFQPYGHAFGQRNNSIFFKFALADVNGFSLKIHIGDFQVNHFLSAQACRLD